MTPTVLLVSILASLFASFAFWVILPSLERVREKWRQRNANNPLTPENEANLLKQLRMQEQSLQRLTQFRQRPIDRLLYMTQLLAFGFLSFIFTVYLHFFGKFAQGDKILLGLSGPLSVFFFVMAIIQERNMTDSRLSHDIDKLKDNIEKAKAKLKLYGGTSS
jgi:hypothetical protein